MTVPPALVAQWESAYRHYGTASDNATRARPGDHGAADAVASASWRVAALWQDMATYQDLPWWTVAALRAAASAFEQQARDWHAKAAALAPESRPMDGW